MATLTDVKGNEVAEMDWMAEGLGSIDQDTVEQLGAKFPFIQWVHGSSKNKKLGGLDYTGGWFMQEGQVDEEALRAAGWAPFTLAHKGGEETAGWAMRDLTVSILLMRHCWVVQDGDQAAFFPWDQYDEAKAQGKPRGKTQVLVVVKGLEDVGPVVLTMRGSTGQEFSNARSGVLADFNRRLIQPANIAAAKRKIKARWAFRAFWLTVGPKRNADGTPAYDTVGTGSESSEVTLPAALGLPEKATEGDVRTAYVGRELLELLNAIQAENADWKAAWDTMGTVDTVSHDAEAETEAEVAALAHEKEELPF